MANGTIAFDTLQTSGQITGTAKSVDTDFVVNGSAKAWVKSIGDGTPTISVSFNIASLTDNDTGDQSYTYTNGMSSSNYVSMATAIDDDTAVTVQNLNADTSALTRVHSHQDSDGAAIDTDGKNITVMGDLA